GRPTGSAIGFVLRELGSFGTTSRVRPMGGHKGRPYELGSFSENGIGFVLRNSKLALFCRMPRANAVCDQSRLRRCACNSLVKQPTQRSTCLHENVVGSMASGSKGDRERQLLTARSGTAYGALPPRRACIHPLDRRERFLVRTFRCHRR